VRRRLLAVTEVLREHPAIGRRTDDPAIRRAVVSPYPYLIFYEPTPDAIIVHAVRHAARDPAGMPGATS
jgi:plasmid stabilization system protein ParE